MARRMIPDQRTEGPFSNGSNTPEPAKMAIKLRADIRAKIVPLLLSSWGLLSGTFDSLVSFIVPPTISGGGIGVFGIFGGGIGS